MKAQDLKQMLAESKQIRLIDVREHDEFEASDDKLEGAENVPMGKMFAEAANGTLPKDQKMIAVCSAGTRCQLVARELKAKGYDIDFLEGGIKAWKASK